jgi:hypothetical protein
MPFASFVDRNEERRDEVRITCSTVEGMRLERLSAVNCHSFLFRQSRL